MTNLEKAMKEANDLASKLLAKSISKENAAVKWLNKGSPTVHADNRMVMTVFALAIAFLML